MKRIVLFLLVILNVFFLLNCTTTSVAPINGSYPKSEEGFCKIISNFQIHKFDGVSVNWYSWENLIIPAGKHTLFYSEKVSFVTDDRSYTKDNVRYIDYDYISGTVIYEVVFDFKKGGKYNITCEFEGIYYNKKTNKISVPEDVRLEIDYDKKHITIYPKVEVKEYGMSPFGNIFITPEATGVLSAGMVNGGIGIFPIGEHFGIGILSGGTDIKLVGVASTGLYIPFSPFAMGLGYNFGGLLEYHFPKIGIGVGGGMYGSITYNSAIERGNTVYYWVYNNFEPYIEINMSFRKDYAHRKHWVFFQYYPSDREDWFNKIGFGYKQTRFDTM